MNGLMEERRGAMHVKLGRSGRGSQRQTLFHVRRCRASHALLFLLPSRVLPYIGIFFFWCKLDNTWLHPARIQAVQTCFERPRSNHSPSPSADRYSLSSFSLFSFYSQSQNKALECLRSRSHLLYCAPAFDLHFYEFKQFGMCFK